MYGAFWEVHTRPVSRGWREHVSKTQVHNTIFDHCGTKIHVDTKDVSKSLFSGSNFPSILPVALTVFQIFFILRGCVVGTLLKKCGYSLQPANKARVLYPDSIKSDNVEEH